MSKFEIEFSPKLVTVTVTYSSALLDEFVGEIIEVTPMSFVNNCKLALVLSPLIIS